MMFRLSEEQRAFVGNVRKLAQSEFRARAPSYMDGSFPWENIRQLAGLGILGMAVPQEYGGSGMGVLDTALVLEEIAKVCYVTAMAVLGEVGTQTRPVNGWPSGATAVNRSVSSVSSPCASEREFSAYSK